MNRASISCTSERRTPKGRRRRSSCKFMATIRIRCGRRQSEAVLHRQFASIYWVDVKSGKSALVASQQTKRRPPSQPRMVARLEMDSPTRSAPNRSPLRVSAYSDRAAEVVSNHRGLSEVTEAGLRSLGQVPVFLRLDGRRSVAGLFSMSNADMRQTRNVYLVVLRKDLPSTLWRRKATRRSRQPPRSPASAPRPGSRKRS